MLSNWMDDIGLCAVAAAMTCAFSSSMPRAYGGTLEEYQSEKHGDSSNTSSDDDDEDDDSEDEDDDASESSEFGDAVGDVVGNIFFRSLAKAIEEGDSATSDESERDPAENCRYREFYNCRASCKRSGEPCLQNCRQYANRLCGYGGTSIARGSAAAPPVQREDRGPSPFYHINWSRPSLMGELGLGIVSNAALLSPRARLRWDHYGMGARVSLLANENTWLVEGDIGPGFSWPIGSSVFTIQPSAMFSAGRGAQTLGGGGLRLHLQYYAPRFMMLGSLLMGYLPRAHHPSIFGELNANARAAVGYRFAPTIYASLGYDFRFVETLEEGTFSRSSGVRLHGVLFSVGYRLN